MGRRKDPQELSIFRKQKLKLPMTEDERRRFSDYHAAKNRKKRSTIPYRAHTLLNSARQSARKKNLKLTITQEWIQEKLERGTCEISKIPFVLESRNTGKWGAGSQQPFAPSLDRTDPVQGYTKENVKLVVWIYNRAKQDSTHADVLRLAQALTKSSSVV
jgi:hypothetical protein